MRILLKANTALAGSARSGEAHGALFDFDPEAGELRKDGIHVRFLSSQASVLLALLIGKAPDVATFAEIETAVWANNVVPAEGRQAIREHINTLRQLFCDSPKDSRFIETVPRKGYRFVGCRVEREPPLSAGNGPVSESHSEAGTELNGSEEVIVESEKAAATTESVPVTVNGAQSATSASVAQSGGFVRHAFRWRAPLIYFVGACCILVVVILGLVRVKSRSVAGPQPAAYPIPRVLAGLAREGQSVRRVALPSAPGLSVISEDGNFLYTTLHESGSVAVVDILQARLVKEIAVGGQPYSIAATPNGRSFYIGDLRDGVRVLDLASERSRHIPTGGPVHDIELSPDGRRLYIAMSYDGLKRLDTATGTIQAIPSIVCPVKLAINAPANTLWISCRCGGPGGRPGHDKLDVLDLATERSVTTVGSDAPIVGGDMAVLPHVSQVWIDGGDACDSPRYDHKGCPAVPSGVLHAFRSTDGQLLKSVPVRTPGSIGFTPDGRRLLFGSNTRLYVFDTSALRLVEAADTNASFTYFSPIRPELYTVSSRPHEIRIVKLPPVECQLPANNVTAHLTADGVGTDLYGAGHAELHGGASYGSGMFGQAFHLDGRGAYVELHTDGSYGFRIEPGYTSSMWVKPERGGQDETLTERLRADGSVHWRMVRRSDSRINLQIFSPVNGLKEMVSRDPAPVGVWSSVSFTSTEEKLMLFLNGVHQSELPGRYPSDVRGARTRFGGGFNGGYYAGFIDEIMVRQAVSITDQKEHDGFLRRCVSADW